MVVRSLFDTQSSSNSSVMMHPQFVLETIYRNAPMALDIIYAWYTKDGISINALKIEVALFMRTMTLTSLT